LQSGEHKGYILYPSIDIALEFIHLYSSIKLYNGIVDYVKRNNIQLTLDPIQLDICIKTYLLTGEYQLKNITIYLLEKLEEKYKNGFKNIIKE
jgi:hypothetical protein